MTEVNCVRNAEGLGFGIIDMMAAVILKGDANLESVRAAEVPGAAGAVAGLLWMMTRQLSGRRGVAF